MEYVIAVVDDKDYIHSLCFKLGKTKEVLFFKAQKAAEAYAKELRENVNTEGLTIKAIPIDGFGILDYIFRCKAQNDVADLKGYFGKIKRRIIKYCT